MARRHGLGPSGRGRVYFQPLTVALVCAILISLFLVTGWMDLKTLDSTLVGYMQNRGLDIIKDVERTAKNNFQALVRTEQAELPFSEETSYLHETLIMDLVRVAQGIDVNWRNTIPGDEEVKAFTSKEHLWLIAFLDDQGIIAFANRNVPENILSSAGPVIKGDDEIKIYISNPPRNENRSDFIALRGKAHKGTIILGLDNQAFRYRSLRVSVQTAADLVGQDSGATYFVVLNQRGEILARAGQTALAANAPVLDAFESAPVPVTRKVVLNGQNMLEITSTFRVKDAFSGIAQVGLSRSGSDQILKKEQMRVFISTAFMAAIALLSIWFLHRNQNRNLARIQEMERSLLHAERLSALGRLAAGLAHEIRNPLNAISMASQRLSRGRPMGVKDNEYNLPELTEVIRDEIRHLNHIVEEFLVFSRGHKLDFAHRDLTGLINQIVLLIHEEAESKGITVETCYSDSPSMIYMDFDKMKQAIFNIVKNAMESISEQGTITLSVQPKEEGWVCIRISDTGCGLVTGEIDHIFDPDYTTKEKGVGLGLPLAHEIILGHGGEIHVLSRPGRGTTFEILLPVKRKFVVANTCRTPEGDWEGSSS
jgi:signal transduction histidine kinase